MPAPYSESKTTRAYKARRTGLVAKKLGMTRFFDKAACTCR